MKTQTFKSLFIQAIFFLGLILSSCQDDNEKPTSTAEKKARAERIIALRNELNFIENFVEDNLMTSSVEGSRGAFSKTIVSRLKTVTPCAEAVEEEQPDGSTKVTMDFGDGCETENGIILSGEAVLIIRVEETSIDFAITFIDYEETQTDETSTGVANGTTSGNFTIDLESFVFTQQLEQDLTVTYEDNTKVDYSASQKMESSETGVQVTKFDASGKLPNGDTFQTKVSKPLVIDFNCEDSEFPVEGIEILTFNGQRIEVDYGNGECDDEYTVK